jgi:MazG family protein
MVIKMDLTNFFERTAGLGSFSVFEAKDFLERKIVSFELNRPLAIRSISKDNFEEVKKKLVETLSPSAPVAFLSEEEYKEGVLGGLDYTPAIFYAGGDFISRTRHGFGDLVEIARRLRDPDGCPWDRAQSHETIRENAIEEAYELVEAIDLRDEAKMLEESGDVLLQALFHAVIDEGAGGFTVEDMLSALAKKLISRHTHIFGKNRAENAEEALLFWEKAKAEEKGYSGVSDKISRVPATFSALMRAEKVQKIIRKTGFDFPSPAEAMIKLREEIEEFLSAPGEKREEEGGDILFAAVNVLRMYHINPETALNLTTNKFIRRFGYVEKKASESGKKVEELSLDEMEFYYREHKKIGMKIGKLSPGTDLILPPVAGFSDIGLRRLCKRYGAGLTFTEMVSAKGLVYGNENTAALLLTDGSEDIKGVQLFGREPEIIAKAAVLPELEKFQIIDINAGCPVPKIVKNGEGSALMKEPLLIHNIVRAVKEAAPDREVTVKMRAGFDKNSVNAVECALAAEKGGASAVTVHGRTRDTMYSGKADLSIIRAVKDALKIPVIGNGDVIDRESYLRMLEYTGADGVAIARGAVGRPWVFSEVRGIPVEYDLFSTVKEHIEILASVLPEKLVVNVMKKHIAAYMKGVRGGKQVKEVAYAAESIYALLSVFECSLSLPIPTHR